MTTTTAARQTAANNAFLSGVKRVMGPAIFREAARLVNAEGEASARAFLSRQVAGLVGPAETPAAAPAAAPAALTDAALLAEIEGLRRERFARTGKVPVYELRAAVAAKYGPEAARHATLDRRLVELDRGEQVRLISIGDQGRATRQQLDDSIPGEGEVFFLIDRAA
jgi:hypothetical protein